MAKYADTKPALFVCVCVDLRVLVLPPLKGLFTGPYWQNKNIQGDPKRLYIWSKFLFRLLFVTSNYIKNYLECMRVEEQRLFATLQSEYLTASLHDSTGGVRHSSYTAYMEQWKTNWNTESLLTEIFQESSAKTSLLPRVFLPTMTLKVFSPGPLFK